MSKGIPFLVAAMFGFGGILGWAGTAGWGVEKPRNNPPSVREDSARIHRSGHHRTRYFSGGGIHHGK